MNQKPERIGNITSSEIHRIMSNDRSGKAPGKPFFELIAECNFERRLKRSVCEETTSRPTSWGNVAEKRVFDLIGTEYKLCGDETIVHPEFDWWAGSPDGIKIVKQRAVLEVKSPATLKSFCTLAECTTIEEVRNNHKDGEKYFWQCVSNAILTDSDRAELLIYCPYKSELQEIRQLAETFTDGSLYKYWWIVNSNDEELPYLLDGGHYKNLNVIPFEISAEDKQALTERIIQAGKLLIKRS